MIKTRPGEDGAVASALALLEIDEVARVRTTNASTVFTVEEEAYAAARSDPDRRLAARLAAKQAAQSLLGESVALNEIEVVRGSYGPPRLRLSGGAEQRMKELGAGTALVSLTHERRHAAALVLLLPEKP